MVASLDDVMAMIDHLHTGYVRAIKCSAEDFDKIWHSPDRRLERPPCGDRRILLMPTSAGRVLVEPDRELQSGVFRTEGDDYPDWNRDGTDSWPNSTGGWLRR